MQLRMDGDCGLEKARNATIALGKDKMVAF